MARERFDVVVVGAGPIGLATAYQCAKRGKTVLVLEQFALFNQSGSSSDLVRMFRTAYTEPFMVDLMVECQRLWKQLETDAKQELIHMSGLLNFGDPTYGGGPEGRLLDPLNNLKERDMRFRQLDRDGIQREYPFTNLPDAFEGYWAADNGCINVPATLRALHSLCLGTGLVEVRQYAHVQRLHVRDDEAVVVMRQGSADPTASHQVQKIHAGKVALTQGVYVNEVLERSFGIKVNLQIWEMASEYYSVDPDVQFPSMWFQFANNSADGRSNLMYGFPSVSWGPPNLARVAVDFAARIITDPRQRKPGPAPADVRTVRDFVAHHLRGVNPTPSFACTCLQGNVPDNMFVLDLLPSELGKGRIALFTAGWAMKCVPLIGHALADLLLTGSTEFKIDPFRINRSGVLKRSGTPRARAHFARRLRMQHRAQHQSVPRQLRVHAHHRDTVTVGIVGAGAAGLYAALLLQSFGIHAELFEAAPRIGGRIYTHYFTDDHKPGAKGTPSFYDYFDAGAMRFPKIEIMRRVIGGEKWSLVNYLNARIPVEKRIDLKPYYLSDKLEGNALLHFNGQLIRAAEEVAEEDTLRFGLGDGGNVPREYVRKGSGYWTGQAFDTYIKELEASFDEGIEKLVAIDGLSTRRFLREQLPVSVVDWLETRESSSGLYDQAVVESILDAFDFDGQVEWQLIDGGTSRLVDAMAHLLPGQIHTSAAVRKLSPQKTSHFPQGQIKMEFWGTSAQRSRDPDEHSASETTAPPKAFDHVINTAPLGAQRVMDMAECALSYEKRAALRMLHYDTSVKVALHFKSRWWERGDHPIIGGTTSTDLPIRTVVYPSYGLQEDGTPDPSLPGVIIASYAWAQDAARLSSFTDEQLAFLCLDNLRRMHGDVVIREYDNKYKVVDWSRDTFTHGAFALFGPEQFTQYYTSLIAPAADGLLHFAGEATSCHHAWIVGALDSAYRCVHEIFMREGWIDRVKQLKKKWGKIDEIDYEDSGDSDCDSDSEIQETRDQLSPSTPAE